MDTKSKIKDDLHIKHFDRQGEIEERVPTFAEQ